MLLPMLITAALWWLFCKDCLIARQYPSYKGVNLIVPVHLTAVTFMLAVTAAVVFVFKDTVWSSAKWEAARNILSKKLTYKDVMGIDPPDQKEEDTYVAFTSILDEDLQSLRNCSGRLARLYAWNVVLVAAGCLSSCLCAYWSLAFQDIWMFHASFRIGLCTAGLVFFHLIISFIPVLTTFRIDGTMSKPAMRAQFKAYRAVAATIGEEIEGTKISDMIDGE